MGARPRSPAAIVTSVAATLWLACTRVPASIEIEAPPPAQRRSPKPTRDSEARWYGDLQLRPRARPPQQLSKGEVRDVLDLPPPSAAELEAWDGQVEVRPSETDLANLDELARYWRELECLRLVMLSVGNATYNDFDREGFEIFAHTFADVTEQWMKAIINTTPPELLESPVLGIVVTASGMLIEGYPVAYINEDIDELERLDELWGYYRRKAERQLPGLGTNAAIDADRCRAFLDEES